MKILSNKEYNTLLNKNEILETAKNDSEFQYKKQIQHYEFLLEEINYNLTDIVKQINNKMSKDKIKIKLEAIIKQIGGKI